MAEIKNQAAAASADRLVKLLVEMHTRPGDVVDWKRVDLMWNAGGVSNPGAFKAATDFAAAPENGLLELRGDQHILTQKGYERGGGLPVQAVRWAEDIVEILAAFFHERGGDNFTVTELSQQWQKNREHRPADLSAGLGYGVQQGWFTKVDDDNYTLTAKGRAQV